MTAAEPGEPRAELPHPALAGRHLVLYDGVCGLCNRAVLFVLHRDRRDRFRFASLQSELGAAVLRPRSVDPERLDTFLVLADCGRSSERLLARARAALFVAGELGWPWRAAKLLGVLPAPVLDLGYRLLARWRYRLFGRYDTCPVPRPEHRARFLDT